MAKSFFREEFQSTFEAMGNVLNDVVAAMRREGCICEQDEPWTRLCIEEALVNAIRHGNLCDEERKVSLEVLQSEGCCTIRVRDEGKGFCPDTVDMPDCDQLGGRGVCLIRHYMDNVEFDCVAGCLEMSFGIKACARGD